jgi:hypothetical protein
MARPTLTLLLTLRVDDRRSVRRGDDPHEPTALIDDRRGAWKAA